MQRGGAKTWPVKGHRAKKPNAAGKPSAAHSSVDPAQERLVERLKRDRDEGVELQAGSAEILEIIGSSPGDGSGGLECNVQPFTKLTSTAMLAAAAFVAITFTAAPATAQENPSCLQGRQ